MATIQPATISNDLMATVNPKAKAVSTDTVQADTDKFLSLLVTQLKNQDPMNPLDNAQITTQLAQMSTVTGVNKLNTTLESLKASFQSSEALQAANMIGHGVLAPGHSLTLASGQSIMGVELASPADNVQLLIRDSSGRQIQAIDLGAKAAGVIPLGWDGAIDDTDGAGTPGMARDGKYSFEVLATRAGVKLEDATPLTFGSVASVSTGALGVKLNVPAIGSLTMADIKQIL